MAQEERIPGEGGEWEVQLRSGDGYKGIWRYRDQGRKARSLTVLPGMDGNP